VSDYPYVAAATGDDFDVKVIRVSRETPVMVDFWAEWCGPCRSLTPILHEIVAELDGAVMLVTVDTDREMELARRYQIRSLPTVKLFRDGVPVDEFMGALPASRVRAFLEPYVVRESDCTAEQATALAHQGDFEAARTLFADALESEPGNLRVRLRYAEEAVRAGETDLADELLRQVPIESAQDPGVQRLKALISFHGLIHPETSEERLETGAASSPPDPGALRELAARKVLGGEYAGALSLQLKLLETDKQYADRAAQKDMLAVFELVDDPELVADYRRRMAGLLY